MLLSVKLRDTLLAVGDKVLSATEIFAGGTVSGVLSFIANRGFQADLVIEGVHEYSVVQSGIVIIGESPRSVSSKVSAWEERKGIVVDVPGRRFKNLHEFYVYLDKAPVQVAVSTAARRLVLVLSNCKVELKEGFARLELHVKAPEEVVEAKAAVVPSR